MKIVHLLNHNRIEKEADESISFLLANKLGGYCYLSEGPISRYQGVFFRKNNKLFKVIENIKVLNAPKQTELKNCFINVQRKRENIIEKFFMPYLYNSLVYELNAESDVELILDIRESYSNPEFGRFYEISEEQGKLVIKYSQEKELECYLVVGGYKSFVRNERWFKQEYSLDKERNSSPSEKYVFSALTLRAKKLCFSFSLSKEQALKECNIVMRRLIKLESHQKKSFAEIIKKNRSILKNITNKEILFAYLCALSSLNNLIVKDENPGIYAGLPWFFQFWTRDETISLQAVKHIESSIIKKLLKNLINSIQDGKVPNKRPIGDALSSDSLGWIIHRIYGLDKKLLKNQIISNLLSNLDESIQENSPKETWMDSIPRSGARIEIQALKLFMLKAANKKENEYKLRKEVREHFWNGFCLKDGIGDSAIRPNIFLAAYIYPELLTREEWIICFNHATQKLWCEWGGLSTIDKNSPLFTPEHTGENPNSYHNGDSWFWINDLSALVLLRINQHKFRIQIRQIIKASSDEMLWKGIIGCHSELSSAAQLKSQGCPCQAWSSAMFIELIGELSRKISKQ